MKHSRSKFFLWRNSVAWISACCVVLLAGCSGTNESSVSGVVTLDGQAMSKGNVTFHPLAEGAMAYAEIQKNGTYTIQTGSTSGLVPGEYKITVVAYEVIEPTAKNPDRQPRPLSPTQYTSPETTPLKATVTSGDNVIPLELTK